MRGALFFVLSILVLVIHSAKSEVVCKSGDTYLPDPLDCGKYYQCANGRPISISCPEGLHFNPYLNVCDYPGSAGCEKPLVDCPKDEEILLPHPLDCNKYFACDHGRPIEMPCPATLHFSPKLQICTWPNEAGCTVGQTTSSTPSTTTSEVTTQQPTEKPTDEPTEIPTEQPTETPTAEPSQQTTEEPIIPTEGPTEKPTEEPTEEPTEKPTEKPTEEPTEQPTEQPTEEPTEKPTEKPTEEPTEEPTEVPTEKPTEEPTELPTEIPTQGPTTVSTTETPTEPNETTPVETTTEEPEEPEKPLVKCPPHKHVLLPHPYSCRKYFKCVRGKATERTCLAFLHFSPKRQICTLPHLAGCVITSTTARPPTNPSTTQEPTEETTVETTPEPTEPSTEQTTVETTPEPTEPTTEETTVETTSEPTVEIITEEPATEPEKPLVKCPPHKYVLLPHPYNCRKYFSCLRGKATERTCIAFLHFSPKRQICTLPHIAGCVVVSTTSRPPTNPSTTPEPTEETTVETTPEPTELTTEVTTVETTPEPTEPVTEETTIETTTEPPVETTTEEPEEPEKPLVKCPPHKHVLLPHPYSCRKYFKCVRGKATERTCTAFLHFSPKRQVCTLPHLAGCVITSTTSRPPTNPSTTQEPTEETTAETTPKPTEPPTEETTVETTPEPTEPVTEETTIETTTEPPVETTTEEPEEPEKPLVKCPPHKHVLLPHPYSCRKYFKCVRGKATERTCLAFLHFSPKRQICTLPHLAGCVITSTTSRPPTNPSTTQEPTEETTVETTPEPTEPTTEETTVETTPEPTEPVTEVTTSETPVETTTEEPEEPEKPLVKCPPHKHILLPHPYSCRKYFKCVRGKATERTCLAFLHFSPKRQICTLPHLAGCVITSTTSRPPTNPSTTQEPTEETTVETTPEPTEPTTEETTVETTPEPTEPVTEVTTSETPVETTTEEPEEPEKPLVKCPPHKHVLLPHPYSCRKYFKCVRGKATERTCPAFLHFSPKRQICTLPHLAGCVIASTTSRPPTNPSTTQEPTEETTVETTPEPTTEETTVETTPEPTEPVTEETTIETTTEPPVETTTAEPEEPEKPLVKCPPHRYVLLPHPYSCRKYFSCIRGKAIERTCPLFLHFSPKRQICTLPHLAGCVIGSTTSRPPTNPSTTPGPTEETTVETTPEPTETTQQPTETTEQTVETTSTQIPTETTTEETYPESTQTTQTPTETTPEETVPESTQTTQTPTETTTEETVPESTQTTQTPTEATTEETVPESTQTKQTPTETTAEETTPEPTQTTPKPTETTTEKTTENPLEPIVTCKPGDTYLPDPLDCGKFYQCANGVPVSITCPAGLHFNPHINVCDYPESAGCEKPLVECPKDKEILLPHPETCNKYFACDNGRPIEMPCPANLHFSPELQICTWPNEAGCTVD